MQYFRIMKTVVQVSSRGTMTLPKAVRKTLGVDAGGMLQVSAGEDGVVLQPVVSFPIELYAESRIAEFDAEDRKLARHLKKKGL